MMLSIIGTHKKQDVQSMHNRSPICIFEERVMTFTTNESITFLMVGVEIPNIQERRVRAGLNSCVNEEDLSQDKTAHDYTT
jgi:hypothetical protein